MQRILAACTILSILLTACAPDTRFVSALPESGTIGISGTDERAPSFLGEGAARRYQEKALAIRPPVPKPFPVAPARTDIDDAPFLTRTETEFAALLNRRRVQNDLHALLRDPTLDGAAGLRASEMLEYGYFAHRRPDGTPWHTVLNDEFPYPLARKAENLAMASYEGDEPLHQSAGDWFAQWAHSPPQEDNMLSPGFTTFGIGIRWRFEDGRYTAIAVAVFGSGSSLSPP